MVATTVGMFTIVSLIWLLKVEKRRWMKVLLAYAVVFTTACVLLFDTVLRAE